MLFIFKKFPRQAEWDICPTGNCCYNNTAVPNGFSSNDLHRIAKEFVQMIQSYVSPSMVTT